MIAKRNHPNLTPIYSALQTVHDTPHHTAYVSEDKEGLLLVRLGARVDLSILLCMAQAIPVFSDLGS